MHVMEATKVIQARKAIWAAQEKETTQVNEAAQL